MGSSVIGRVKCWMRPEAHGEFTEMVEINNEGTFNATSLKMNLLMVFFQSSDLLMVRIQFSLCSIYNRLTIKLAGYRSRGENRELVYTSQQVNALLYLLVLAG